MQVQITIRGRQYTVRGDEGEDIVRVAGAVDAQMEQIASRAPALDEYTVALMVALNLASELHRIRGRVTNRLEDIDREAASLGAMLESLMPDEAGS